MCVPRHGLRLQMQIDRVVTLLLHLRPDNVFVVPAVNQRLDLALCVSAKQRSTLHAFAEENVTGLRDEFFPWTTIALGIEMAAFGCNGRRSLWP